MKYLGNVSSEGAPFLIADANDARVWQGSDSDGFDYKRACEALGADSAVIISMGQGKGVIWDRGEGTADIFITEDNNLVIVGAWLDNSETSDDLHAISALASLPLNHEMIVGSLLIQSGALAIIWAPENGDCITNINVRGSERPLGPTAIEESVLLIELPIGEYICMVDEIEIESDSAMRCHLIQRS